MNIEVKIYNFIVYCFIGTLGFSTIVFAGPRENIDMNAPIRGPHGNIAHIASDISLSDTEKESVIKKRYKAALVWHGSSLWVNALTQGAVDTFKNLGIEVVAITDAQYDTARQASDVENVLALKPDIILTLPISSVSGGNTYKPAVERGIKLVLLSNPIEGYLPNRDYVGIVTDDMRGMGIAAAELMRDALGGGGKIGVIYHDADYFITNNRDNAFRMAITGKNEFKDIKIVTEMGFANENEVANIIYAMILRYPDIRGIYVSWDAAAESVVEELRAQGRSDVKVITYDLGVNNLLDMAIGSNMYGTISDRPYDIGRVMALLGVYGLLNKKAPEFTIVDFDKVTRKNIGAIWVKSLKRDLPNSLYNALK